MTSEYQISAKQAALMVNAQKQVDEAQKMVDVIAAAILAGLDVEGRVVSVDTESCILTVEVPDIPQAA